MSAPGPHAGDRAAALRVAFDDAFVRAPLLDTAQVDEFLEIRLGPTAYMLRTSEISGLFVDKAITPLPTPVPELLGIVGLQRTVVPVFDLGALLGHRSDVSPRWIVVAHAAPAAFAFARFERHVRVSRDAVMSTGQHGPDRHVRGVVRVGDDTRPIASLASVLEAVAGRVRVSTPHRKQEAEHG